MLATLSFSSRRVWSLLIVLTLSHNEAAMALTDSPVPQGRFRGIGGGPLDSVARPVQVDLERVEGSVDIGVHGRISVVG